MFKGLVRYLVIFVVAWPLLYVCYNSLSYRANAFEADAYVAYAKSIAEDGDFNILNNRDPQFNWVVTPKFNVPDMHDHGTAVFWAPGAFAARALSSWGFPNVHGSRGPESTYLPLIFFSSVFLLLLFSAMLFKALNIAGIKAAFMPALFLCGTPLLYYALSEFTAADSVCFAFAALLVSLLARFDKDRSSDIFLLGLLTGFSRAVKISFLFWWPLIFLFVFYSLRGRPRRKFFIFLSGLACSLTAFFINSQIQFSRVSFFGGYEYDLSFERSDYFLNLFENIVGPFGVLHQAPWLIAALLITGLYAGKTSRPEMRFLSIAVLISVVAKFLYEGHAISAAETEYGFRRYTLDAAFLCWPVMAAQTEFPRARKFLIGTFALACLYNFLYFFWFRDIDKNFLSAFGVKYIFSDKHLADGAKDFLLYIDELFLRRPIGGLFYLTGVFTAALLFFSRFHRVISARWIGMALVMFYIFLTGLNITFNPVNSSDFAASDYAKRSIIADAPQLYVYDEALSEFARNLLLAKYKKDETSFQANRTKLLSYLDSLAEGIQSDPIGFIEDLKKGKYRGSAFYPGVDINELLDFNAPGVFEKAFKPQTPP